LRSSGCAVPNPALRETSYLKQNHIEYRFP